MTVRDLWLRLRAVLAPRQADSELEEELRFHTDMLTRRHVAAGRSVREAQRLALAQFGSTALVEDQCRDVRGIGVLETTWQDVRYAVRNLRRTPTFALTVIGTIALGLGLNAAVFTVFNGYVLRPAAVRDPYSLYDFTWTNRAGRGHFFTWPEYEAFRQQNHVFSEMFAGRKQVVTRVNGHPAFGQLVTGNYFHLLGVGAALGRTLRAEDSSSPGREAVVVLSYSFWQRLFAGDPGIVGKKILIRGYPCVVVGVAREGFAGLDLVPHDFFAPITLDAQLEDGPDLFGAKHPGRLEIIGRLKPGISKGSAEAALTLWARDVTAAYADEEQTTGARLTSRATAIPILPEVVLAISPILLAFALVLVIACANVANMMLARAMARQREIGIRLALGAARSRIVRQLLTESALLALPAALAGFAVSAATVGFGMRVLFATLPGEYADYIKIAPLPSDLRVFAYTMAAAAASVSIFGLVPALQATRANVVQAARGDFNEGLQPARLRSALVVLQITCSAVLVICAGVLLREANRVGAIDIGMRTRDVIAISIREESRPRVVSALTAEPLVEAVAATSSAPLNADASGVSVTPSSEIAPVMASYQFSSAEYFTVLDIPLLSGRNFTEEEMRAAASVAIVTQTAARRLWPGRNAIGQTLALVPAQRTRPGIPIWRYGDVQIVGVARDVTIGFKGPDPERTGIYLPTNSLTAGNVLLVRVKGDAEVARRQLDAALTAVDQGAVREIHKMQEFVEGRVYPFRLAYWVSAAIGMLALLLTVSGIYGVLSYLVMQRAKEIGIRIALGATVAAVTGFVVRQSLGLAVWGLAFGMLLALGASKILASKLVISTFDAVAYGAGVLVVLTACVAAASFPALRAARVHPIDALRHD